MQRIARLKRFPTTATGRTARGSLAALAVAGVAGLLLAAGCQEQICSSGEYPVKLVGSTTGNACAAEGEEPPKDYVRYPEGKVPKHVDDKWDKYWGKHTLDKDGNFVK